jgi:hypothetical protein
MNAEPLRKCWCGKRMTTWSGSRFYLAVTLQTFLLLLAADSNPPLRADPSPICALLVRAVSSYPTLFSRLMERTSARRSCTPMAAWAAKDESCER